MSYGCAEKRVSPAVCCLGADGDPKETLTRSCRVCHCLDVFQSFP